MTKLKIVTLILLALFVSSCQGAPKTVIDTAIASIINSGFCHQDNISLGGECREFKVARAVRNPITDADKANGIDDSWCIQIDYIKKRVNSDKWEQVTEVIYITKSGDIVEIPPKFFWLNDMDYCLEQ